MTALSAADREWLITAVAKAIHGGEKDRDASWDGLASFERLQYANRALRLLDQYSEADQRVKTLCIELEKADQEITWWRDLHRRQASQTTGGPPPACNDAWVNVAAPSITEAEQSAPPLRSES